MCGRASAPTSLLSPLLDCKLAETDCTMNQDSPQVSPAVAEHITKQAPFMLLQICTSWRNLALSTPALWKRYGLEVELDYSPLHYEANSRKNLADWASHSSAAPLSLGFLETLRPMPAQMGALIARYGPRYECLRLRASLKSVAELSDPGTLPLLRKLGIAYSLGSILHDTVRVCAFRDTPALRELILGPHTVPSMLMLPWGQLTTFTGDSFSVAECLFVLRASPRLTCTFLYLPPGAPGGRNLTHSSLEDFSISNSAADILGYIELPALRDLHLTKLTLIDTHALRRLFAGCAPSVHRLHYAPTYLYRDSVFIDAMPHLTNLDLSSVSTQFTHAFVRSLNRLHEPTFLPGLRTLRIECEWREIGMEVGAEVVAALTSRSTDNDDVGFGTQVCAVKLRSFRLIWAEEGWLDALHMSAMLELIQGGMDINIGSAREYYIYA